MANKTYYNTGDAMSDIIKYKKWWDEANSAGDTAAMENAQKMASSAYSWLERNGGAEGRTIANQLSKLDYEGAKKYATDNKTKLREYAYTVGNQYGFTPEELDKYISYDNATRNVSIGGKNIGTPDVVIDGVSYVSDEAIVENAVKDLAKQTNTNLSERELSQRNSTEVNEKINDLYGTQQSDRQMMTDKYGKLEDASYANPFTSDEAKAIMGKYDLAALQGRDNAVASGGASNGGNIDSYAAANAMRQQAALTNQGQMAVLDAHNNKLNNVRSTLEGLGVYLQNQDTGMQKTIGMQQNEAQRLFENAESHDQRLFDNEQTTKLNDTEILKTQADVSGYTPQEWLYKNNPYLNADGTVNESFLTEEFDATGGFKTLLDDVEKRLAETTDAEEKAKLKQEAYYLQQAINRKVQSDTTGKYAQYANTVKALTPEVTEARRQSEQNDATSRYMVDSELEGAKYTADKSKEASDYAAEQEKAATENKAILDANTQAQKNATDIVVAQIKEGADDDITIDENGNVVVNENGYDGDDSGYAPFETWNTDGYTLSPVSINDDGDYERTGCDQYGREAIAKAFEAIANGKIGKNGEVTNYELADFLITESANHHTDKKQLKKVFQYFGLNANLLNYVEDVGKGQNLPGDDFMYGVEYKLN